MFLLTKKYQKKNLSLQRRDRIELSMKWKRSSEERLAYDAKIKALEAKLEAATPAEDIDELIKDV